MQFQADWYTLLDVARHFDGVDAREPTMDSRKGAFAAGALVLDGELVVELVASAFGRIALADLGSGLEC